MLLANDTLLFLSVLCLVGLLLLAPQLQRQERRALGRRTRRPGASAWCRSLLRLSLFCLPALYGCGTAPLPAPTSLPVPAALLIRPRPPVLLQPDLALPTPGTTTPKTPASAPKTASGTTI